MAERIRPHVIVERPAFAQSFTPPPRRITSKQGPAPEQRGQHGRNLRASIQSAQADGHDRRARPADYLGANVGTYVTFHSFPGVELVLESLDPRQGNVHPELRAVSEIVHSGEEVVEQATVFVPEGKMAYFLRRINQYIQSSSDDTVRHHRLIDPIQEISLTLLEALWTDDAADFPGPNELVWWEVWLRRQDGEELAEFRRFAEEGGMEIARRSLAFRDRAVVQIRGSREKLANSLDKFDGIAELRQPSVLAQSIAGQSAVEQREWVDELLERMRVAEVGAPAVCIVDTGVDRGNPLLLASLSQSDCHACDAAWSIEDHSGHGTEMGGIALYGDVGAALVSPEEVRLLHRLESVKLLPDRSENDPDLYGALTATCASRVEIQAPNRPRIFCMAVTAAPPQAAPGQEDGRDLNPGQPSSWSAAVDALAAGAGVALSEADEVFLDEANPAERRLFVIAAGNVTYPASTSDYLDRNDLEPILDPAQAWNAVTVGASTQLDVLDPNDVQWSGWTPVAPRGELSPFSRTSVLFDPGWPHKPDVVFEGGNVASSPDVTEVDTPDAFQVLTTKRLFPDQRPLTTSSMTSAATAGVAHIGASVLADYPDLWPETVRALIVHSAEWTPKMLSQFNQHGKKERIAVLRRYGMGIPDALRATRSADDALTMVAQGTIRPFDENQKMGEMKLHTLPWPTDVLSGLGSAQATMRVTLSYFINPNPSRRGWRGRYRYASHGLRFDVRRPTEANDDFCSRLNAAARVDGERPTTVDTDSAEWFLGRGSRAAGSLHSDIWTGTAADLARRGSVAVYPVSGWRKDVRASEFEPLEARYALVVSIETEAVDVDLWTPVAAEVGIVVQT